MQLLCFSSLFLQGRTKLRFLSLGIDVIEEWLADSKHESVEVYIYINEVEQYERISAEHTFTVLLILKFFFF